MNARLLLNLGLVVVVGGLAALAWFDRETEEQGPPLTTLDREAIRQIRLEHPGQPLIRLEKQADGGWRLIEPVAAAADRFEVSGILNLAGLETRKTLAAPVANLAELGLAPPAYRVQLDDTALGLGGIETLNFRRYVLLPDGRVALVDDPPSAALDADYSDLVARELLPPAASLSRIEVPGLTVEKTAEGGWRSPEQPAASATRLETFAAEWGKAAAMWNGAMGEVPADAGEVRLTLADGQRLRLLIAAREPQLQLVNPELRVRYSLSKALEDSLLALPPEAPAPAAEGEATAAEAAVTAPASP